MALLRWGLAALSLVACTEACTSFYMPKNIGYNMIARTMDYETPLFWQIRSYPPSSEEKIGFVGIESALVNNQKFVVGGLSTKSVTCDAQILVGARYQSIVAPSGKSQKGIFAGSFCGWVLSTFGSVSEVIVALNSKKYVIWGPIDNKLLGLHFVVRDGSGHSVVVEYVDAEQYLYPDSLDSVDSVPVVTNEPTYDFHLQNVALLRWKMQKERAALGIPANFYPDERMLRVYITLQGIKTIDVSSYDEALSVTMSVADRVHVPKGEQYGTDTGTKSGSFNSHTQYSVVYDLSKLRFYWRTASNPSLQGIRLNAIDLTVNASSVSMDINNHLPTFNDVTDLLK